MHIKNMDINKLRRDLPAIVSGTVEHGVEDSDVYPKVLPKLPDDWTLNYHATAYNIWTNGQKPGDESLRINYPLSVREGSFDSSFFRPLSTTSRDIEINENNWEPVGMIVLANKKDLGSHGGYHPEIREGSKLVLVGRTFSKKAGSGQLERRAPVYVYALKSSLTS